MEDVRRLFREYIAWIGLDLSFQNFERELAELPGDYVAPKGTLLIARVDGLVAGCVAAHEWEIGVCEMKRLFVRDTARGTGCGRALVEKIIGWARDSGYASVLLDTLPVMDQAQNLYARLGFTDVPAYRPNPVPGARFLRLDLPR
jgi:carbonic anhydrase